MEVYNGCRNITMLIFDDLGKSGAEDCQRKNGSGIGTYIGELRYWESGKKEPIWIDPAGTV